MNYSADSWLAPSIPAKSPTSQAAPTPRSPARSAAWCGSAAPSAACRAAKLAQESGTSERYLAQIESGAGNPSILVMRAIADALEIPLFEMLPQTGGLSAPLRPHHRSAGACIARRSVGDCRNDRAADRGRRRSRPRPPDRACRFARRGQIHARQDAGGKARRAVHRARPPGRAGIRRQHAAADRDVRCRHLQTA